MAADKKQIKAALKVAKIIRKHLDGRKWNYSVSSDELEFSFGVNTDALPFYYRIAVDAAKEVVYLSAKQNVFVPESKRIVMAMGICAINDHLVDGSFDFNVGDGSMLFRLVASYHDAEIGDAMVNYLINVAHSTFEDVNKSIINYVEDTIDQTEFLKQMMD